MSLLLPLHIHESPVFLSSFSMTAQNKFHTILLLQLSRQLSCSPGRVICINVSILTHLYNIISYFRGFINWTLVLFVNFILLLFTLFQQQTLRYRKQEFPYAKPCAKLYFHPEIRYTVNQLLLITLCKSSPSTSFSMYQFEYGGQTECFVYGEKYGKIIIC